jgi:transcriptional regulator with GAF, ATPase, and Fis domain
VLFGHERGAFTGASATHKGVFEQAAGGTLLIDEIGDLDLGLQPKLLRAIQRSEVQRVGGSQWIPVDVRVIAATRRDLDREVQRGRFRDDLFFRLAVGRVELPPLRRRREDVAGLARHFWQSLGGDPSLFAGDLLERYADYSWPGNVRELHNLMARRLALGDLDERSPIALAAAAGQASSLVPSFDEDTIEKILALDLPLPQARRKAVEELERRYVQRVLARSGGNVGVAAAASGIARRYFEMIKSRRSR